VSSLLHNTPRRCCPTWESTGCPPLHRPTAETIVMQLQASHPARS